MKSTVKCHLIPPLAFTLMIASITTTLILRENARENTEKDMVNTRESKTKEQTTEYDEELITYIRQRLVRPPATAPYNLTHSEKSRFSWYFDQKRNGIFNEKPNGFFVEVRARDGEKQSHSLFFEKFLSWTGVLVEPNPSLFKELLAKNRKAYAVNARIAITETAQHSEMTHSDAFRSSEPSIPFMALMQALNINKVDFFSLDVDGDELKVLQTIPWDKFKTELLCVKTNRSPGGYSFIMKYMGEKGYSTLDLINGDLLFALL